MLSTRSKFACALVVGALAVGIGAPSAGAQTTQRGLVNVAVDDVNVPIGVAANVCNVSANVLSQAIGSPSGVGDCDAVAEPTATGGGGPGHTRQEGLVNIAVTDVNIPIGVAANVCNVSISVLSSAIGSPSGAGECDAVALPTAS